MLILLGHRIMAKDLKAIPIGMTIIMKPIRVGKSLKLQKR